MKVGIVGPTGSGKTTIFNALTGQTAQTGGAARKTHMGVVQVPDPRMNALQKLTGRKNRVHAEITFSDVAGELTKPSKERGLDPELANMMKALDAFAIVLGDFPEYKALRDNKVKLAADAAEIESDLMLGDLLPIEGKLERMKKEKPDEIEKHALEKCKAFLDEEKPLRLLELNSVEDNVLGSYSFLSQKPVLFIRNVAEEDIGKPVDKELEEFAKSHGARLLTVSAKVEMEISQMEPADREGFLKELGIGESALDKFIRASYEACSLICFFTTGAGGPDETRAWTIRRGSSAVEAGGKIHSDIRRGFIRAEVIGYNDFMESGGFEGAKSHGKFRLEGKDYIVQDGDIINFRFNV